MELVLQTRHKQIGESIPIAFSEQIAPVSYAGRTVALEGPLSLDAVLYYDGGVFTVTGTVRCVIGAICARCAEPYVERMEIPFSERFVKSSEPQDEDACYTYEGDTLRLDDAVMDNLLLSLPLAGVCSEDCKGLCPICGVNRNVTECACQQEGTKPNPFAELEQLRDQD